MKKDKQFIGQAGEAVKIKGVKYIDVTLNSKVMHYLVEGLMKLNEKPTNKEKVDLEVINDELREIIDELSKI